MEGGSEERTNKRTIHYKSERTKRKRRDWKEEKDLRVKASNDKRHIEHIASYFLVLCTRAIPQIYTSCLQDVKLKKACAHGIFRHGVGMNGTETEACTSSRIIRKREKGSRGFKIMSRNKDEGQPSLPGHLELERRWEQTDVCGVRHKDEEFRRMTGMREVEEICEKQNGKDRGHVHDTKLDCIRDKSVEF